MTRRATLRGAERVPLAAGRARADVLICGGSFAGLSVARELAGAGADVLVVDRYALGERQTSACAAPTPWLHAMGVQRAIRQELPCMAFHTPHGSVRYRLPWSWSAFDYRTLCEELWAQCGEARFEICTVAGNGAQVTSPAAAPPGVAEGETLSIRTNGAQVTSPAAAPPGVAEGETLQVITDRGPLTAPLVVDALGWRRILGAGANVQPPDARLSRGLEVHPEGGGTDLDVWIDRSLVRHGYAWSVPAASEQRIGVGSYEPRHAVKEPTKQLAARLGRPPERYQGNWFPHALRPAVEGGVFFAGDSAGHCFPLSGEGIRTAFYFGIACGRELRAVCEGAGTRERALDRYGAFSAAHAGAFRRAFALQWLIPRLPPRALTALLAVLGRERPCRAAFEWYLAQAHPSFAAASR